MSRPFAGRGGALAQIVAQGREPHGQRGLCVGRGVQHHHEVHAGIDFGMVLGRLGHAPQAVDLRHQALQRPAGAQHLEQAARTRLHEAAREFLPHPFGHQCVDLPLLHHAPTQRQGFVGHGEVRPTRGKAGQAQDANRVFGEGLADVPQGLGLQVGLAATRVDQGPVLVLCDGVDGEVAPAQVLFQGDGGIGMEFKAVIAACGLALGAGQGHFLTRLRVQEDGEFASHGDIPFAGEIFSTGTHDHPIAVTGEASHQVVAYGPTHQVLAPACGVFVGRGHGEPRANDGPSGRADHPAARSLGPGPGRSGRWPAATRA